MNTKERLKAEIDNLDEAETNELYQVVKRFLQAKAHRLDEIHEASTTTSGLCGIWQDDRTAEEIIADIISARSPGRDVVL
ncbi:MAG: hypothetical protein V2J55_16310 [Candidatus Competibacteraceae bacterium]|jgi:hypothetical protein|nr:hypothetical protein [Candidatus Competibacteraceae bacterium]